MMMRIGPALAALTLLAACNGESGITREEGGTGEAEGEVLGGSISDEMLPLDTVRSQSPPMKERAPAADGSSTETPGDAEAEEDGSGTPPAGADPAGEPAEPSEEG